MSSAPSLEEWLRRIPPVTRALVGATAGVTLAVTVGVVKVEHLMMYWPLVYRRLHLWRILTDFLYSGAFSFGWIFHMWLFLTYSSQLEKHTSFSAAVCGGSRGAFLYFIALQMLLLQLLSLVVFWPNGQPLLNGSLLYAVIYYWARREPYIQVSLWGLPLQGWQLPYALLVLDVLMGASLWQDVMGLVAGHIYYYVRDVLPAETNKRPLEQVPKVFDALTDWLAGTTTTAAPPATTTPRFSGSGRVNFATLHGQPPQQQPPRTEFPGQGRRLNE